MKVQFQPVYSIHQLGAADNTWVIYLSDHGDNMGEHGFWSKLNFYEDSVRVPFVVVPPGYANPGAQCETPVSLVDWMSTVLDLTGQESVFEKMPGHSLMPLIGDPAQQCPERSVLADSWRPMPATGAWSCSTRQGPCPRRRLGTRSLHPSAPIDSPGRCYWRGSSLSMSPSAPPVTTGSPLGCCDIGRIFRIVAPSPTSRPPRDANKTPASFAKSGGFIDDFYLEVDIDIGVSAS